MVTVGGDFVAVVVLSVGSADVVMAVVVAELVRGTARPGSGSDHARFRKSVPYGGR